MQPTKRPRYTRSLFIALLATIAVGVISTFGFGGGRSHSPANTPDTLNVAIGYGPMSLYRYADTLGGFNYEMMRAVGREAALTVKFHPVSSLSEALARLREGAYDVVISDIAMTAAQRQSVDFTVPVYTDKLVLVSADSTVTSPLQLAGRKVWAPEGSPAVERLRNLEREIGDTIYIEDSHPYTSEQLLLLVANGEVERAVVNEAVARTLTLQYPSIHISTDISFSQFQAWAVAKGNSSLLETLDKAIERFKATPAYETLCEKWIDGAAD